MHAQNRNLSQRAQQWVKDNASYGEDESLSASFFSKIFSIPMVRINGFYKPDIRVIPTDTDISIEYMTPEMLYRMNQKHGCHIIFSMSLQYVKARLAANENFHEKFNAFIDSLEAKIRDVRDGRMQEGDEVIWRDIWNT